MSSSTSLLSHCLSFHLKRRHWLALTISSCLNPIRLTQAQGLSAATLRMIVPFEAGGITDHLGRAAAKSLSDQMKRSWIVENVPGAGGALGAMRVARHHQPTEYLLHANAGTFRSYGQGLRKEISFDPLLELRALAIIGEMPILCVAHSKQPAPDLRQYLDHLHSQSRPFVFGTVGIGNTSHVLAAIMAERRSLEAKVIPYKGSAAALRGLLSEEIPIAFVDPFAAIPLIQNRKLKCLGLSSPSPYSELQGYSSFKQLGLGPDTSLWSGFFASSKISHPDYQELTQHLRLMVQTGSMANTLESALIKPMALYGDHAQRYVIDDVKSFQKQFKVLGLTLT